MFEDGYDVAHHGDPQVIEVFLVEVAQHAGLHTVVCE